MATNDFVTFTRTVFVCSHAITRRLRHVTDGEPAHIDVRRTEVELSKRFQNGITLELRELVARQLADV